jgi:hypothetical protein
MGLHVRLGRVLTDMRSSMDPVWVPDPYDVTDSINVGRNAFRFPQVQAVLTRAFETLCAVQLDQLPDVAAWMQEQPSIKEKLAAARASRAVGDPGADQVYTDLMAQRFPILVQVLEFGRR